MSSWENLTINDSPIINSPLTSSPLLSAPVSAPLTSSPSNVRYSSWLYHNGVKYEWGKDKWYTEFTYYFPWTTKSYWQGNWCVFSWWLDLNSDWLYLNNSYSNWEMYLPFTKSLSNISKISLEINYYAWWNWNYWWQEVLWLSANSNISWVYAYSVCNYDKVLWARTQSLVFSWSTLVNAQQYFYDWLEKYTLEIDFWTWKMTRINSWTNSYTQEYTLSESDLNNCRTFDWIVFRNMAWYNHYIIDANLKFYK